MVTARRCADPRAHVGCLRAGAFSKRGCVKPGSNAMPLLVTSASGANGNGHGALLAFDRDGKPLGLFSEDSRIADPRGLAVEPKECLLFLNSANRVLALDTAGKIVRDTGVIAGLNPGGGTFGPDGRHY